jgi:hypothetical protein
MSGTPLATAFVRVRAETSSIKSDTEASLKTIDGTSAGRTLGDGLVRGADGRLRDANGRFVTTAGGIGKRSGTRFSETFRESFKGILAGFGVSLGVEKIVDGFKDVVGAGRDANKNLALTRQVIKTTGGAAGVTAEQVDGLATSISEKTGIDNDQILSGARLLLTFKDIGNQAGANNDIFNQATGIVQDMSVALGQDAKSSAIQLGKALNDPTKGITALQRVGVSFTAQQRAQIKAMAASGDTLGAQKIILGELSSEFGGAAEAAATNSGKLSAATEDLREKAGQKLIPVIDSLSGFLLNDLGPALGAVGHDIAEVGGFVLQHSTSFKVLGAAVLALTVLTAAHEVILAIASGRIKEWILQTTLAKVATAAWNAVLATWDALMAANPVVLLAIAIAALVAGIIIAYRHSETFRDIVKATFSTIKNVVLSVVGAVVGFVKAHWVLLVSIIGGPVVAIAALVITHFTQIRSFIASVVSHILAVFDKLASLQAKAESWFGGILSGAKNKLGSLLTYVAGIPGRVVSKLVHIDAALVSSGEDLIRGFIRGIENEAGSIVSAIEHTITDKLPGFVKKALGIGSPSRVFADLGRWVPIGMAQGINSQQSAVSKAMADLVRLPATSPLTVGVQAATGRSAGGTSGTTGAAASGALVHLEVAKVELIRGGPEDVARGLQYELLKRGGL